jgi:hypothetical protein
MQKSRLGFGLHFKGPFAALNCKTHVACQKGIESVRPASTRIASHVLRCARRIVGALGEFGSGPVQDPVLNKIDALLTLTELSLLADKAVFQFAIPVVSIQSFTNCPADH